ncbi:hypothetical protein G6M89_20595 [Natronolimnobius sp. AArcel1]|uniref:toxin-antitoxin system TumE family protein n=1 Tax=Natronolimnobius sp. AArcel1 TaxID=1679093 RepID=UPI0013EA44B3|nr:DUF6516 family protein [Natronolimnobius sp. AArcel1]NGM71365.1 hypothetical protein [Natronolimnobius sp. AArcel1]
MADGDVVLNRNFEIDAQEGTRAELFAVEDSSYPGGYYYRFQYYAPEDGQQILRYDNAHDSDIGHHHRHVGDDVTGIEFDGLQDHVARFQQEVLQINARR